MQKHLLNTEHLASQTEQQEVNEVKRLDSVSVVQRASSISVVIRAVVWETALKMMSKGDSLSCL